MFIKTIPANKLTVDSSDSSAVDELGLLRMDIHGNIYESVQCISTTLIGRPVWHRSTAGTQSYVVTPTKTDSPDPRPYGATIGTITAGNYGYVFKRGIPAQIRTKAAAVIKSKLLYAKAGLFSTCAGTTQFSVAGFGWTTPADSIATFAGRFDML